MRSANRLNPAPWLEKQLFKPSDPRSLSLFRFLYCSVLLWRIYESSTGYAAKVGAVAWNPIPIFETLGIRLMSAEAFAVWCYVLMGALALTALGVFTRTSATVAWIAYFVYMGTYLGFSKAPDTNYVSHSKNIVVFVLIILSVAPGVALYGFDGWRRRRWRWRVTELSQAQISAWPIQLVKLTLALAYFGAGYCKVVNSPLWADGYTLQAYLVSKNLLLDTGLGLWLANHYWLCLALSIGTLLLELTFLAVVFFPRLTWFYALGGLAFHSMIWLTMKINFFPFFGITYLIFLDWPTLKSLATWPSRCWSWARQVVLGIKPAASRARLATPGTTAPLGDTWTARGVVLGVSGMLLLCVVARVECWPFTDYRVFENRTRVEKQRVYRVAGRTMDGKLRYLSRREHPVSPVAIHKRVRAQRKGENFAATEALLVEVAQHVVEKSNGRYSSVVLLERVPQYEPGSKRITILDKEVLQVPLAALMKGAQAGRMATVDADSRVK